MVRASRGACARAVSGRPSSKITCLCLPRRALVSSVRPSRAGSLFPDQFSRLDPREECARHAR
eukprot:6596721-Pyramimonas_sp.AAC.1